MHTLTTKGINAKIQNISSCMIDESFCTSHVSSQCLHLIPVLFYFVTRAFNKKEKYPCVINLRQCREACSV